MKNLSPILHRYVQDIPSGKLIWIGIRPNHKETMIELNTVRALRDSGLEGDHRTNKILGSGRQMTLISEEYIQMIKHFSGNQNLNPAMLRRNIVISGINLSALRYQRFRIGTAEFEANALCDPCSRMEQAIGKGGFAAMLGHGGLCCKITREGIISVGDDVVVLTAQGDLFKNVDGVISSSMSMF